MASPWLIHNPIYKTATSVAALIGCVAVGIGGGSLAAMASNHMISLNTQWQLVPRVLWALKFDPDIYMPFLEYSAFSGAIAGAGIMMLANQQASLFGDAQFANRSDIVKDNLFKGNGAYIGRWRGKWMRSDKQKHNLIVAPPGGGKGVTYIIPNLLMLHGSVMAIDIKRENFSSSSGYRQKVLGQKVYVFDPLNTNGESHRFNPLGYIDRNDPLEIFAELQQVATRLVTQGPNDKSFFIDSPRSAFIAIGSYVAYHEEMPFTLGQIYRVLSNKPEIVLAEFLDRYRKNFTGSPHDKWVSQGALDVISAFISNHNETLQNIKSSLTAKLGWVANPRIDFFTSESDFDLRDIRNTPMTIYLAATESQLNVLGPLYSLLFQQLADMNTHSEAPKGRSPWAKLLDDCESIIRQPTPVVPQSSKMMSLLTQAASIMRKVSRAHTHWRNGVSFGTKNAVPVYLFMDEFAQLGNFEQIKKGLSYYRSFGLNVSIVVQSEAQLDDIYGVYTAKVMKQMCETKIYYKPANHDVAEEISRRLGTYTYKNRTMSHNRRALFAKNADSLGSTNESGAGRALLMPQEVVKMPDRMSIIFRGAVNPILSVRPIFYKISKLKKRSKIPPITVNAFTNEELVEFARRVSLVPILSDTDVKEPKNIDQNPEVLSEKTPLRASFLTNDFEQLRKDMARNAAGSKDQNGVKFKYKPELSNAIQSEKLRLFFAASTVLTEDDADFGTAHSVDDQEGEENALSQGN